MIDKTLFVVETRGVARHQRQRLPTAVMINSASDDGSGTVVELADGGK